MDDTKFVRINASGVREIFLNDCEWKDLLILLTDRHDIEMPSKFSSYGCVSLETCGSAEYLKSLSPRTPRKMVGRSGTIHDECPDCRGEGCTVAADAAQGGGKRGMNKVYGGTVLHTESRCATCRYSHSWRGLADSSQSFRCTAYTPTMFVKQPVTECNRYDDARMPSRYDMEQIAWVLVTRGAGKVVGFVSASQLRNGAPPQVPGFARASEKGE